MTTTTNLQFLNFKPELATHFKTINQQWIEDMFEMEPLDQEILNHPKRMVIDNGGHIWFAQHPSLGIVGTVAIFKKSTGVFELTKMGVLKTARGLKIGEHLLAYVLASQIVLNLKCLFLLTNTKCEAAIHLYTKSGFEHDKQIMQDYGQAYKRCNVAMRYIPHKT